MRLPEGTISGSSLAIGDLTAADCGFVHEFSHRPEARGRGKPNLAIARYINSDPIIHNLPLFVSHSITLALEDLDSDIVPYDEFEGISAKGTQENLGTWGELVQGKSDMQEYGFTRPVLITSRYNIGNVALQAQKLGLEPIAPPNLPGGFDWRSDQLWTKHWLAWAALAYPRIYAIRKSSH